MSKTLMVNFQTLNEFGDNFLAYVTEIESCLTELKTELDSLTSSAWVGVDSAQYKTKVNKTLENLNNIKADVEKYGNFAKATVGEYQQIVANAVGKLG